MTSGPAGAGRQPRPAGTGRQDARVGYRGTWGSSRSSPGAAYAVLDLAGHHLGRIERRELLGALVGEWPERVDVPSTPHRR